jgi:hypothetical protein
MEAPVLTLSNGLTVVNFASPEIIAFEDGSELLGCSVKRVNHLGLKVSEKIVDKDMWKDANTKVPLQQVYTARTLTPHLTQELYRLRADTSVDIILVSRDVMDACKKVGSNTTKLYTVYMISPLWVASISKFGK